jgi:hypothetical protein
LDTACLLAVALEGIVYGFSVLLFIGTIWSLAAKQRIQSVNRPIATVAILLFILSTAHMIVNIIRVEDGLVKYRDTYPGGPVAFFADPAQITLLILRGLYVLQTLLADGVVIYRCYIVWQSVYIIILPCMLWCSVAATGISVVYTYSQAASVSTDFFANVVGEITRWVTAFFASTMATNALSSGLLAYRIWTIERNVSAVRTTKSTMIPIIRMLVDAAVLYTVVLFIGLICFVTSNNGVEPVVDMIMPIIAIAFYMVLIRMAINRKNRSHVPIGTDQSGYPMQSLQVHVSQYTRSDGTYVANEDKPSTLTDSGKASLKS